MVDSLLLSFFINDILLHGNTRHFKCADVFTIVLQSCSQCSFLHIQIYLKYICSSKVRYEKKYYMTIITGQPNSFSRLVHPTNVVFIVGNVNIRVQRSDPNFRPAASALE